MMTRHEDIFKHNPAYDKEKIVVDFDKFKVDQKFYPIDKLELGTVLSRDERTFNYIVREKFTDKELIKRLTSFALTNSLYLTGDNVALNFSKKDGDNKATISGAAIWVSLSPLCDFRIPFHVRLNAVGGLILHELFHCAYTTPEVGAMLQAKGYTKREINMITGAPTTQPDFDKVNKLWGNHLFKDLTNFLEDRRIEKIGLLRHPGRIYFFEDKRRYALWRRYNLLYEKAAKLNKRTKKKKEWYGRLFGNNSDDNNDDDRNSLLLEYILLKTLAPELLELFDKIKPTADWFTQRQKAVDRIVDNDVNTYREVYEQCEELHKLFDQEYKETRKDEEQDPALMIPFDDLPEEIQQMLNEVAEEINEEFSELQDSEKEKIPARYKGNGESNYNEYAIFDAEKGMFDKLIYDEAIEISQNIQTNISFLDSKFSRIQHDYEQYQGELDEGELYSLQFKRNIFYEEHPSPGYNLDLGILVDESGSMGGTNIKQACTATLALALAFREHENLNLFVYGHTADCLGTDVAMFRYIDSAQRVDDLNNLFSIRSRSQNADGYAIAKMGEILNQGNAQKKVLLVVSDGMPAASCYRYSPESFDDTGIGHTRQMVQKLEDQGMLVVQVAIDNIDDSPKMFNHYVPYDGTALGENLRQILIRELIEINKTL